MKQPTPGPAVPDRGHVYVIMPVRNRREVTRSCLEALRAQSYQPLTVVVVDDGSSDGTSEMVRRQFPEVVLLRGDGDLWWTRATNLGVGWVLGQGDPGDWLLTLNDDTSFGPTFVAALVRTALAHPGALVGAVSVDDRSTPVVLDGGVRIKWATAKHTIVGLGRPYAEVRREQGSPVEVNALPGRGMLVPLEALRRVGLFDQERLPHYAADYEFSIRAGRAGYRLLVDYGAVLVNRLPERPYAQEEGVPGLGMLMRQLTSRRSPLELRTRLAFALRACPRTLVVQYMLLDLARVVGGAMRTYVHRYLRRERQAPAWPT